jgi:hypothetical protein
VEHTYRLLRAGYGGTLERIDGQQRAIYFLIKGDLTVVSSQSYNNKEDEERNLQLARHLMGLEGYRSPWSNDIELRQFRSESGSAMSDGPERFRLTPAEFQASRGQGPERSFLSRLFYGT